MTPNDLLTLDQRALRRVLEEGHPIDPRALDDTEYHGTALAMPAPIAAMTWTKFFKTFRRQPLSDHLVGWNCAAIQNALDEPWIRKERGGKLVTYWHYRVVETGDVHMPYNARQGLLIDYGLGGNPPWDPTSYTRDPLVAVNPGSVDLLLGVSFVAIGPLAIHTPTFFSLQRGKPLDYDAKSWRDG